MRPPVKKFNKKHFSYYTIITENQKKCKRNRIILQFVYIFVGICTDTAYRVRNRRKSAAACTLYKAVAIGTLGNSGVALVSSYGDTAERAVILCYHIVLALRNSTSDAIVFLLVIHIHNEQLLFFYCFKSNSIIGQQIRKYSRIKKILGEIIKKSTGFIRISVNRQTVKAAKLLIHNS